MAVPRLVGLARAEVVHRHHLPHGGHALALGVDPLHEARQLASVVETSLQQQIEEEAEYYEPSEPEQTGVLMGESSDDHYYESVAELADVVRTYLDQEYQSLKADEAECDFELRVVDGEPALAGTATIALNQQLS